MHKDKPTRDRVDDHVDRWHEIWTHPEGRDALVEAALTRMKAIAGLSRQALLDVLATEPVGRDLFDTLHSLITGPAATATPAELADRCDVTRAGMTSRLDRLEAEGLVQRNPDPHDRRSTLITPTAAGQEVWDRVVVAWGEAEMELFGALTAGQMSQLNDLMRKVLLANGQVSRNAPTSLAAVAKDEPKSAPRED